MCVCSFCVSLFSAWGSSVCLCMPSLPSVWLVQSLCCSHASCCPPTGGLGSGWFFLFCIWGLFLLRAHCFMFCVLLFLRKFVFFVGHQAGTPVLCVCVCCRSYPFAWCNHCVARVRLKWYTVFFCGSCFSFCAVMLRRPIVRAMHRVGFRRKPRPFCKIC